MEKPTSYDLPWDRNLETEVAWIDKQHKQLLNNLANMASYIAQNKSEENVRELVTFLNDYIRLHFNAEQSYMQRFNYPQIDDHLGQHQWFVKQFKDKEKKYILNGPSRQLAAEITRDLWGWFKDHICEYDKEFAVFYKERNSQPSTMKENGDNELN